MERAAAVGVRDFRIVPGGCTLWRAAPLLTLRLPFAASPTKHKAAKSLPPRSQIRQRDMPLQGRPANPPRPSPSGEEVGLALGTQAGETRLREVILSGVFCVRLRSQSELV